MYDCSRGSDRRPVFCRHVSRTQAGRSVGRGFLLAGIFGVLCACGSDDSAPQTGLGGGSSVTAATDAGPASPGEGFEATPDFDITSPQRPVPPRQQIVDGVATLNGSGGSGGSGGVILDAGADSGADAGR